MMWTLTVFLTPISAYIPRTKTNIIQNLHTEEVYTALTKTNVALKQSETFQVEQDFDARLSGRVRS